MECFEVGKAKPGTAHFAGQGGPDNMNYLGSTDNMGNANSIIISDSIENMNNTSGLTDSIRKTPFKFTHFALVIQKSERVSKDDYM